MNISHQIRQNWINSDLGHSVFIVLDNPTFDVYYTLDLSVFWWCLQKEASDDHKILNHDDIICTDVRKKIDVNSHSSTKTIEICDTNEDKQNVMEPKEEKAPQMELNPVNSDDKTSIDAKGGHKLLEGYKYEIVSCKNNHIKKSYKWLFSGCSKIFGKAWNFLDHARMHEGIKPFTWDVCSRSFTQYGNLRKHSRQHQNPDITSRKTHKCPICPCTYTEKYNLKVGNATIFLKS